MADGWHVTDRRRLLPRDPKLQSQHPSSNESLVLQAGVAFDHLPSPSATSFHSRPASDDTHRTWALLLTRRCKDVPVLHRQLSPAASSQPLWPQTSQPVRLRRVFLTFASGGASGSDSICSTGPSSETAATRATAGVSQDTANVAGSSITAEDVYGMAGGMG